MLFLTSLLYSYISKVLHTYRRGPWTEFNIFETGVTWKAWNSKFSDSLCPICVREIEIMFVSSGRGVPQKICSCNYGKVGSAKYPHVSDLYLLICLRTVNHFPSTSKWCVQVWRFFLIQSHLNELRIVNNAAVQVRVVEPIGLVSVSQSEHVGSKLKCLFFAAGLGQVDAQPT